jgi:hypothetical protein
MVKPAKSGSSKSGENTNIKTDAPPPPSKTAPPSSGADLLGNLGLNSSGVSEVLSSGSPTEALRQTITHPVILAVVVGGLLMAFGGRR